ncbi:MAG TPA: 30S ribosomal protein S1 [Elusimicrobia bacterium]|nr:30S ribosomal protein S1 [Elusimicrobiota bacterium]
MEDHKEEDFESLLNQEFKQPVRLEPGQAVEAVIVKISSEYVFLNVGTKGEGLLERREVLDDAGNLIVQEGDKIRAYYLPSNDREMRFTVRIGSGSVGTAQMRDAKANGIPVEGMVAKEVKGGFEIKIGTVRAFCPFSQMGLARNEDRASVVGRSLIFKVTECGDRNVVLSRKAIVEAERKEKAQGLKETLKEGMRVQGRVTSLQKFGAFVDIGGVEGLLPVSEIAWSRTEKVEDKLSLGQEVEVVIKKLDWDNDRLSFSLKDALPDPWERAAELWPLGTYHTGKVSRLAPFGAFVTLGEGVDGLIHISKLGAGRRIAHPKEVISEGQDVEVRVEGVDVAARKLSLSLASLSRAAEEDAQTLKEYQDKAARPPAESGTLADLLKAKRERKD